MADAFNAMTETIETQEDLRRAYASEVARELRTPLMIQRSQLEAMADGLMAPDAGGLRSLLEENQRLSRLVADLEVLGSAEAACFSLRRRHLDLAAHRGRALVESPAGSGAVFRVVLPARPGGVGRGESAAVASPARVPTPSHVGLEWDMNAKQAVRHAVENQRAQLIALSRRIHGHPELPFEEEAASVWLADHLTACGFEVERGAHELPTALVARAGRGSLRVALCAEYDALPGIGHACGHNLIAAAAAGAAAGLAAAADDLDLTLLVIGTPGEELYSLASVPDDVRGPGKALLLERGAFDGVHLALMVHPAPVDIATTPPRAAGRLHASFRLRDEVAGTRFADPAELRRLDEAMAVAQVAVSALATHLPPAARVSTVGTSGCWSTTSTDAEIGFGASSLADLQDLEQALDRCFQAGALGTGTEVELTSHLPYAELRPDPELVAAYRANAEALGRAFPDLGPLLDRLNYATDMGNVSHRVPAIHPFFGIGASVVNHDPAFAGFAAGDLAHDAMVQAAVALAWTAVDAATRPELRSRLRQPAPS